jgi:proteasome beta subunit
VYGVLEDHFQKDLSVSDGVDLAVRALHAAMKRDSASGDGYTVATITADGFTFVDDKEIQKRLAKLKLSA